MTKCFKTLCSCALDSGIEKLDFISSLMRRPDQILWKLGRKGNGEPVFDVLNSYMILQMSGIQEAFMFAHEENLNGEEILSELLQIAQDIIDSKEDGYPFAVVIYPGEMDSASFRFAEADKEQYPEKRNIFGVSREGRLHYEGMPVLYGDDPVPIDTGAMEKAGPFRGFTGPARLKLINGYQVDSFGKFTTVAERIIEDECFGSLLFELS